MGKVKRERNRGRHRFNHPAAVGCVEQQQQQQGDVYENSDQLDSIWDKLSGSEPFEREMACRTLAHIEFNGKLINHVIEERLAKRIVLLLSDPVLTVREAAAMALRKMCSCDSKAECCDHLVSEGVLTTLCAHLRECFQELNKPIAETSGATLSEAQATRTQLLSATEEALNLLWCLCEQTQSAVEAFNEGSLLALVVYFLQLQRFPLSLVTAAAQCLHIVTEDNAVATRSLCATSDSLVLLESLLLHPQPVEGGSDSTGALWLLLNTSVAGVLYNLLPLLQGPAYTATLRAMLSVLAAVLDVEVETLLLQLQSVPSGAEQGQPQSAIAENGGEECGGSTSTGCGAVESDTAPGMQDGSCSDTITLSAPMALTQKFSDVETVLSSQQLALELITNLCSMEDEDDTEEEEVEFDMEVDGANPPQDHEAPPHVPSPSQVEVVSSLAELGLFSKVWKICRSINEHTYQLCKAAEGGQEIAEIMDVLQGRSLYAMQNLLTVLPQDSLGGKDNIMGVWHSLLEFVRLGGRFLDAHTSALVGVMGVLLEKLSTYGSMDIVAEDLKLLCQLGQSPDPRVRSGTMQLLGTIGKMAAVDTELPTRKAMLNTIGVTLKKCVSHDPKLWVLSHALDSIFDIFGEDNCPLSLYQGLGMHSALKGAAATFIYRIVAERKDVKPHIKIVRSAQSNLPAFIQYMASRAKCEN